MNQSFATLSDSIHVMQKKQTDPLSNSEVIKYLIQHPTHTMAVYWNNLHENICSGNPYISNKKNHSLSKWTGNLNTNFFYSIHCFMFILWLLYLFLMIKKKYSSEYLFVLFCGILSYYILLTSGLTFWAGDRLVSPAVALWGSLYPIIIFSFYKWIQGNLDLLRFQRVSQHNSKEK